MSTDCGENKFEPEKFKQDIGKLGEKMGMSKECIKHSRNKFSSFQASGKASLLGGLGGSLSVGVSGTSSDDSKFEKGCGAFLMNASKIHNLTNNVKCTLNNNTSDMQVSSNANAEIIVKTRVPPDVQKELTKQYHETMRFQLELAMKTNLSKEQKDTMIAAKKAITASYKAAMGSLSMNNTRLKNDITTNIKVLIMQQLKNNQEIVENFKKIASAAANAKISETAGTNALSSNTKQLITQTINNNEQNIKKNIQNIINNTKIEQNSKGKIEIISSSSIELKNTIIDQNIAVSIAAEAIQSSAIDIGLKTATQMTSDATSDSETVTKSAGLNDLAKNLADGNTDAIGKVMEGGWGNMDNLFIVGGVVIVGLAIVAGLSGGKGRKMDKYMPLPPLPPPLKGMPPPLPSVKGMPMVKGMPPPPPPVKGMPVVKGMPPPPPVKGIPQKGFY